VIHGVTLAGSEMQLGAVAAFRAAMKERLAKKPEIAEVLTPSFGVGCRRLTPGPGYLEALVEDNVNFVPEKIRSIDATGVELENGSKIELDALVCATGFNASGPPPFGVTGKNGATLEQRYKPFPESYLAVAMDGFPNFFFMLGPNSAIGSGSLTMILEVEGDYIIKCIRKLQKEDYLSMMPKRERVKDFSDYTAEYFKKTVRPHPFFSSLSRIPCPALQPPRILLSPLYSYGLTHKPGLHGQLQLLVPQRRRPRLAHHRPLARQHAALSRNAPRPSLGRFRVRKLRRE
jgi:hypothetical protein